MKNRFGICLFIVVLAILAVLFWLKPKRATTIASPIPATVQPTNTPTMSNIPAVAPMSAPPPTVNQRPSFTTNHPSLTEMVEQEVESRNKPIDFYGLVIDQNSNAVSGVKIKSGVRHWKNAGPEFGYVGATTIPLETTTGADGRFELTGASGDVFGIGITKDGYILSPKSPRGFAAGASSYENPVVFKMWKNGEAQNLISHDLSRVGIPVDGSEVQFDLVNGAKVQSGGQLIMRIKRDPQVLPPGHFRYDWSAELEIPNGGIIASDDDFAYQAPESGYHENYIVEMPKDAQNWATTLNQQFYIRLPNGNYGSLTVNLLTFHSPPPVVLTLGITVNPSGSRNLQP